MTEKITLLIMAAFLVEFVVQALKSIFPSPKESEKALRFWELIATGVGILVAVLVRVNVVDLVLVTDGVSWWIGVGITGIIIGRGASFVYSLIGKLQDAGKPVAEVITIKNNLSSKDSVDEVAEEQAIIR